MGEMGYFVCPLHLEVVMEENALLGDYSPVEVTVALNSRVLSSYMS